MSPFARVFVAVIAWSLPTITLAQQDSMPSNPLQAPVGHRQPTANDVPANDSSAGGKRVIAKPPRTGPGAKGRRRARQARDRKDMLCMLIRGGHCEVLKPTTTVGELGGENPCLWQSVDEQELHIASLALPFLERPGPSFVVRVFSNEMELIMMFNIHIPHGSLVLIGDGEKALFLRNKGTAKDVGLTVEQILAQHNPQTREQGTDQPGRSTASAGAPRAAMQETDWHRLAKERFAGEIAEVLYWRAHNKDFTRLIIVAPPKTLSCLRKALHKEVAERVAAEIPKELTSVPVPKIESLLAAS